MLEIKNLKKSYDGITILHDINLAIDDGEIVSILDRPDAARRRF